jgi:hypothetical protein
LKKEVKEDGNVKKNQLKKLSQIKQIVMKRIVTKSEIYKKRRG